MVAMDNVCHLHVYNIPAREHIYELSFETKLTSVDISKDSKYILVNKSDGGAQMFNIETQELVREFVGHKGGEFVIRAAFGGANENFVISGSQGKNPFRHESFEPD
jgi:WD40 repeat protein